MAIRNTGYMAGAKIILKDIASWQVRIAGGGNNAACPEEESKVRSFGGSLQRLRR
jgi:hypothetical protein